MVVVTSRKMLKKWAGFTVPPPYKVESAFGESLDRRSVFLSRFTRLTNYF